MKPETVTAIEIGDYIFCPEAWRLARTGHESANQLAREAGTAHHTRKAAAQKMAGRSVALGRVLTVGALLAMVLLWWLAR